MRRVLVLVLVAAVVAVGFVGNASGRERTSCPNGFVAYNVPQTEAELQGFSRIVAGLAAGVYTVQELIDLGNAIDANTDGIFCLKAVSNLRGNSDAIWGFFYWARDNDAAAS